MNRKDIEQGLRSIGDPDLELVYDFLNEHQLDLDKNYEIVLNKCLASARTGSVEAQHLVAKLLWTGLAGNVDRDAAFHWAKKSAELNYLPAIVMLAGIYEVGTTEIKADQKKSIELLKYAADMGSSRAMVLLGVAHMEGLGVRKDRNLGMMFFSKAANLGDLDGQYEFGKELLNSNVEKKQYEGLKWLINSAEGGSIEASRMLAYLYRNGEGVVSKNNDKSYHYERVVTEFESKFE